ncbi:MAG: hypothetical protein JST28_16970 [Acidobacteria bacterium]|nr:hypothetical protein [Acidobacteriota bacterium]
MASSLLGSQLACTTDSFQHGRLRSIGTRAIAWWHLTSCDAPTVAVVWACAIARTAHIHLESWIAFLLATGTWTVYVFDRLLDARRAIAGNTPELLRERHLFHWRYRRIFIPFAICTALAALAIIVNLMPLAARGNNSVLAVAALAYFSGVHIRPQFPHWLRRLVSKEMLVGILFATGCAAPTLTRLRSAPAWPAVLTLVFLAALAWLNCAAISSWESHQSPRDVSSAAFRLALVASLAAATLATFHPQMPAMLGCVAICAALIAALHHLRGHLNPVTLRALADLVLLVPGILLLPGALPR